MLNAVRSCRLAIPVMLFFSLFARDLAAQTPPPGVTCPTGWLQMSITTIIDPGFPCVAFNAEVWFCIPDPAGPITPKEMLIIKAVRNIDGGTFPCPLTGSAVRQLGEFIMFNMNPGGWQVPVNCSQWCFDHPDCPCPALYPQWVAVNGSCGKIVPEGDSVSIVMCGEVDGEGQNCYYSYQVCKRSNGSIYSRWVGKQIQLMCPGFGMSSECVVPLCDNVWEPEKTKRDTCTEDSTGTRFFSEPDLSGVGMVKDGDSKGREGIQGEFFDKGTRKEDE